MKEKKYLRPTKHRVSEWLYGPEKLYQKVQSKKEDTIGFYLRFLRSNFIPCRECQEKLAKLLATPEDLHLGDDNKPPVELWRRYDDTDDEPETLEDRSSTDEEKERLKDDWFD